MLHAENRIKSAFVIDIDAHTGDGTVDVLAAWDQAEVFNPYAADAKEYFDLVEARLSVLDHADIIAVSAGFDAYLLDVGHKLATPDFEQIGRLIRETSQRVCGGRRFAVLEGGYHCRISEPMCSPCRGFAE